MRIINENVIKVRNFIKNDFDQIKIIFLFWFIREVNVFMSDAIIRIVMDHWFEDIKIINSATGIKNMNVLDNRDINKLNSEYF